MKKKDLIDLIVRNLNKNLVLSYFLKFDDGRSLPEEILNKLTKKELEEFLPIISFENGWKGVDK